MRKLELCSHFIVSWHNVTTAFAMVDYVGEMIAKKSCKHHECGSFEHVLLLFSKEGIYFMVMTMQNQV